jgi:serine protease Do
VGDSARRIIVGQKHTGALTTRDRQLAADSTYAQEWSLDARAGQTVTIDLEAADFDPFVFLLGPGITRPQQDDDGGGHCNARLTATLPDSGIYTIVVNTAQKRATGRFTLIVTAGSKLPSLARCARVR